jgi:hypothetical protein
MADGLFDAVGQGAGCQHVRINERPGRSVRKDISALTGRARFHHFAALFMMMMAGGSSSINHREAPYPRIVALS